MLCEATIWGSFWLTWGLLTVLGLISVFVLSGSVFWVYYINASFEKWQYKINPEFPAADKVRMEIIVMLKGLVAATFCPSLALYLARHQLSYAFCGLRIPQLESIESNFIHFSLEVAMFAFIWIFTDLWEFSYHYMGHKYDFFWSIHKDHHQFFNPSPFAVIADEWIDQFVRALPLLILPVVMPINVDLMFFQYALFFYGYGVYLHWGFELEWPNAHTAYLNGSFHHYFHHALSIKNKPYYTGFYFKIWDNIMGSVWKGECCCSKCAREKGLRTKELWDKVEKPDYSPLFTLAFWLTGKQKTV